MMTTRNDRAKLDAAPTTDEGKVDRPVPFECWWVPSVVLDGHQLRWRIDGGRWVQRPRRLLESFLQLADADPKRIFHFARKWGVFGICRHGLPSSHNRGPVPRPDILIGEPPSCQPQGFYQGAPQEDVAAWNAYARKFWAVVNIAMRLREGKRALTEDWAKLESVENRGLLVPLPRTSEDTIATDRVRCAAVLEQLLDQAGVRPSVSWTAEGLPALSYSGAGLFAALTMQLVLVCASSEGLAQCAGCGLPYSPSRQPRAGERNYCPECRAAGIPERDAARAYRNRKPKPRAKKRAPRSGRPPGRARR